MTSKMRCRLVRETAFTGVATHKSTLIVIVKAGEDAPNAYELAT
jgi:hypothetical protein